MTRYQVSSEIYGGFFYSGITLNQFDVFVGELNELVREKDLLALEKKCEHHATETAMNNAREMQKQAAKSAKDAGKNKGKCVVLYLFNLSMEWRRDLPSFMEEKEAEVKQTSFIPFKNIDILRI